MKEKIKFLSDQEQDSGKKNNILIEYLSSGWNPYKITQIDRIVSTDNIHNSGWQVTYLEKSNIEK